MFIITAKVDKRRIITALAAAAIIVAVIVLLAAGFRLAAKTGDTETLSLSAVVKSEEQRIAYLETFGWEVGEKIEEQTITIPLEFNDVYTRYNELQISQGFDLTRYAGQEATRFTYEIMNYPYVDDTVVADIIVYRNQVIAGDVQCVSAENGFMNGLEYPETAE